MQQKLVKTFGKKATVEPANALSLSMHSDNSIDKIITDPPWGLYETSMHIPKFYTQMLKEFYRILRSGGIMVILTAQKELIESLLGNFEGKLKLEEKYSTLVSGKKAGVYKIRKIN